MSIDWSNPVRLISTKAQKRVLCTDRPHTPYCVVLMDMNDGIITMTTKEGRGASGTIIVENIPETEEIDVWINVHKKGDHCYYSSRTAADRSIFAKDRIACINVKRTVEVGEGLNK